MGGNKRLRGLLLPALCVLILAAILIILTCQSRGRKHMPCDGCKYTGSGAAPTATTTPVTFTVAAFDTAPAPYINSLPSTDLVCEQNGRRRVAIKVVWNAPAQNCVVKVFLYLNGSQIDSDETDAVNGGATPTNLLADVYAAFTSGDVLTVSVWQNSGANLGFNVSASLVLEECECSTTTLLGGKPK